MTKHEFVCAYCIAAKRASYTADDVAKAIAKWDEIAKVVEPDKPLRIKNDFIDTMFAGGP